MNILGKYLNKKTDKTMYHYTSQRGLLGIIKTKSLWLTQVAYLNDLSEVSHAFGLMKAAILKNKTERRTTRSNIL